MVKIDLITGFLGSGKTTFNGMALPNIYALKKDNTLEKLTDFDYKDFKYRLRKM